MLHPHQAPQPLDPAQQRQVPQKSDFENQQGLLCPKKPENSEKGEAAFKGAHALTHLPGNPA